MTSKAQTSGMRGVYLVASELARNGLITSPTSRSARGADILATTSDCNRVLVNGHNPLTLLHRALSGGVHELTDERCVELAHDVRVVLVELAERLGQALRDEAELNTAINRLLQANQDN
jgi:hypothetical protein